MNLRGISKSVSWSYHWRFWQHHKGRCVCLTSSHVILLHTKIWNSLHNMIKFQPLFYLKPLHNLFPIDNSRFIIPTHQIQQDQRLQVPEMSPLAPVPIPFTSYYCIYSSILWLFFTVNLSLLWGKNLEIKDSLLLPKYFQHCA